MENKSYKFPALPTWARWALLLPFSIVTYFLINFLCNLLGTLLQFIGRDPYNEKIFTHFISPCVAGFFCVSWPSDWAPKAPKTVGLVLSAIWMAAFGAWAFLGFRLHGFSGLLGPVFSTIGAVYAFSEIRGTYFAPESTTSLEAAKGEESSSSQQ